MTESPQIRILAGPPASGKSTRLLAALKDALKRRDWSVRLLVPSATMAEHIRNQLAREGFLLRKSTVTTLSRFVDEFKLAAPAPDAARLESIIATLLDAHCPADFQAVANQPGFIRHLAGAFDSLSLAGVKPQQLEGALRDVYARTLAALATAKLALRGQRLAQFSAALPDAGLKGISSLLLDGFFSFAKTEIDLMHALSRLVPVQLALPDGAQLAAWNAQCERLPEQLRNPRRHTLVATDRAQEALLIAHRILALAERGVELRRIGVLLRNPAAYAPLLETTFGRLAIPSRSYLGLPLSAHPVTAFHRDFLAAVDSGWDNAFVLAAMRWRFTGLGGTAAGDELERQVKTALPAMGLGWFPQLMPFEHWPKLRLTPLEAARQLKRIASLLEAPFQLEDDLDTAWQWHQRVSAISALHKIFDETALTLDANTPILLSELWQASEANLADQTLHERDTRRNVVHLMDLFESRQWELDYVFAPGMAEGEFPQRFSPDPLLTEALKKSFGMKTLEDRQAEEHFLFEMLLTRATKELTLSYPRSNDKGDPVLPSLLLASTSARTAPACIVAAPTPAFAESNGQLQRNYRSARPWSASEFESYLACPWKHFADRGLNLQGLPVSPPERLNSLLIGTVAHTAIKIWTQDPSRSIEQIGEREFELACRQERVSPGYNYERERINLLRNLRLYARNAPPVPAGWQAFLEQRFSFELEDGPAVRGQIDRYDLSPDGEVHAYDYKYSKRIGLDEKYPIQGALYALALARDPLVKHVSRFSFVALREESRPAVVEGAALENSIQMAQAEIERIVGDVRSGLAPVRPKIPENCEYCDYHDACRIRTRIAEEVEAPAFVSEAAAAEGQDA